MKSKRVATQNARKFVVISQYMINWVSLLLISVLVLVISCSKNDDLETIVNEPPINNKPPINNVPSNSSESLIIYTDIEPDFESEDVFDFYNLDLNNDGVVDFIFLSEGSPSIFWGSSHDDTNINAIAAIIDNNPWFLSFIIPLEKDTVIPNFESTYIYDHNDSIFYTEWIGQTDKYIGLLFNINGKIHYAWARLDVTTPTQWVIKDYAYNATPNRPILAGQKE